MNQLSRALGRWLFHPYRCNICHHMMNIHEGLVISNKDNNIIIHKECKKKYETNSNHKKTV